MLDRCRAGAPPALAAVRAEFGATLCAACDTADADDRFASAFAQTLCFGLLLAREAAAVDITRDAWRALPGELCPLLRATLRALTGDAILDLLGGDFDALLQTVNAAGPALPAAQDGSDPILYFYEDFLAVFDPAARRRHGVFFTPVPVVRSMVTATDRTLRADLGTRGLLDPDVLLLDPACGTGTFLIAAVAQAAAMAATRHGAGAVASEIAGLAGRLHGMERLIGPYTVAQYRLRREIASHGAVPAHHLPIRLADALPPPAAADALKQTAPIVAILGNPPYRRLDEGEERAITSRWDNGFWDDLKAPVRDAGWGGELNTFPDLYIAFWRWTLWKIFESEGATGRGVVCLITNRSYLAGHPYAGLRRMMRQRFDRIDIVDLRGDARAALPAGIARDEGVFAIQTGVCVVTAVATGAARAPAAEARVRYADVWRHGAFAARDKFALLERATTDPDGLGFVTIDRHDLEDFVPLPFEGLDWPDCTEVFRFRHSGIETKRDGFAYGLTADRLVDRFTALSALRLDEQVERFHETALARVGNATARPLRISEISAACYRPLDHRFLMNARRFVDRRRPDLQAAWGTSNVAIYALPSATGGGPALWLAGALPDRHCFRGSCGGYAFPLWDRRRGEAAHNLSPALLAGLARAYGRAVGPQEVFDAIAALLSATSYTRRHAPDLEASFARIPFPAAPGRFAEAARIGAEIRAVETFARAPAPAFRSARLLGQATGAALAVPALERAFIAEAAALGFVPLCDDQSLRLAGVPAPVWRFAVSGYRVLHRWLAARRGEALDAALQGTILDVTWRIEELLHWFDAADAVLAAALAAPLTRPDLGLAIAAGEVAG